MQRIEDAEVLGREEPSGDAVAALVVEASPQALGQRRRRLLEAHPLDALRVDVADLDVRALVELLRQAARPEPGELVGDFARLRVLGHLADVLVEGAGDEWVEGDGDDPRVPLHVPLQAVEEAVDELFVVPVEQRAVGQPRLEEEAPPRLVDEHRRPDDSLLPAGGALHDSDVFDAVSLAGSDPGEFGKLGDEDPVARRGGEPFVRIGVERNKAHGPMLPGSRGPRWIPRKVEMRSSASAASPVPADLRGRSRC